MQLDSNITRKDAIEQAIDHLQDSDRWEDYLNAISRFHHYSWSNQLMIAWQNPEATRVAGLRTWNSLGRSVKAGEHGIRIFAPLVKKMPEIDDDGNTILRPHVYGFRLVSVFDVSQTTGPDVELGQVTLLVGDTLIEDLRSIEQRIPFPIERVPALTLGTANASFSLKTEHIQLRDDLSVNHQVKSLLHEWAHGLRTQGTSALTKRTHENRAVEEVVAESTVYAVAHNRGWDTSDYSMGYVIQWSGGHREVIQEAMAEISRRTKMILTVLDAPETASEALTEMSSAS